MDQEVVINIVNDDGQSIQNADISVNQTASVQIVSLSSQTVQSDLSTLSYQSIENVLLQAKQNPTYFSDPVSKQILKAFEMYGSENLNKFIKEEITASLQSVTSQNQSLIITIKDSTWKKLSISFTGRSCNNHGEKYSNRHHGVHAIHCPIKVYEANTN